MSIITTGIDLAKTIFAVHGVNESGKAELVKPLVSRTTRNSGLAFTHTKANWRVYATCIA